MVQLMKNLYHCDVVTIYAEESLSLTINCGDGAESCDEASVYCPTIPSYKPTCNIQGLTRNNIDDWTKIYAET